VRGVEQGGVQGLAIVLVHQQIHQFPLSGQLVLFAYDHQEGDGEMVGPATDIQIQAEEMLRIRSVTGQILAKHSGKKIEDIDRDTERDNFMSAEEAAAYGLIDSVKSIL